MTCNANGVFGRAIGPFIGPAVIEEVHVLETGGTDTTTEANFMRIDFSEDDVVQSLTFDNGDLPPDYVPDGIPLFEAAVAGSNIVGDSTDIQLGSWFQVSNTTSSSAAQAIHLKLSRYIPYGEFWIKAYHQNDDTSVQIVLLNLAVRFLNLPDACGQPLVGGPFVPPTIPIIPTSPPPVPDPTAPAPAPEPAPAPIDTYAVYRANQYVARFIPTLAEAQRIFDEVVALGPLGVYVSETIMLLNERTGAILQSAQVTR